MIQSLEIFFDGFAWVKDDVVVYTLPNISKTIHYIIDQDGQRSRRHLTKGPPSVLEKNPKEPPGFAHVVPYQCAAPVQMRFPVMEFWENGGFLRKDGQPGCS